MTNTHNGLIVDADGHVLEPLDTWQKYIDPQYRERAVRMEHDANGWEVLLFDNKPCEVSRGTLGAIGGVGSNAEELEAFFTPGKRTYADGARLAVMTRRRALRSWTKSRSIFHCSIRR